MASLYLALRHLNDWESAFLRAIQGDCLALFCHSALYLTNMMLISYSSFYVISVFFLGDCHWYSLLKHPSKLFLVFPFYGALWASHFRVNILNYAFFISGIRHLILLLWRYVLSFSVSISLKFPQREISATNSILYIDLFPHILFLAFLNISGRMSHLNFPRH